jgi:N-acetylglutamate synthase-like GNAT family acetyltransferase
MHHAVAAPAAVTLPAERNQLPKVRLATKEDLNEIISLGRDLHFENGLMPISDKAITEAATNAVSGNDGIVGVIGKPGSIEALTLLQIRTYWYSDCGHLEEMFIYCKPQYRKSSNAKALVMFAMEAAKKLGIPLLVGVISNERTAAKVRLYRRLLGEPAGAFFLYNAKTGKAKA